MPVTKPMRRWGQPHKFIENTPDIARKEAAFLKYGSEMIEYSKKRNPHDVLPDMEKYLEFEKKYPGKPILKIHTHTNSLKGNQIPSAGDISVLAIDYLRNYYLKPESKRSNIITQEDLRFAKPSIISIADENGKEIGRVHIHLTPKAINTLKESYHGENMQSRELMKKKISDNIAQVIYEKFLKKFKKIPNYTANQQEIIVSYSTKYYYENVLGLHMHFNPMPGYKYNSKKLEFEKIK